MTRKLLFIFILFFSIPVFGQEFEAGFHSLAGSNKQLPFWIWANQLGRYNRESSTIQNLRLSGAWKTTSKNGDWNWEVNTDLDLLIGEKTDLRFTVLSTGIDWKSLQLSFGAFHEQEKYSGISASNGNLAATRNARPHPKLRLGFNRFVPVGVSWFSIYGFYEEGLLNDERYIDHTHLHRKAFYFRIGNAENFSFTGGLEHFVMWGGTHPVYGELPGWESYFDYVFVRKGGENALPTDQANRMGNQFGTYQMEIKKNWNTFSGSFYISHPFDDRSGIELQNYRDNLYGLYFKLHEPDAFLQEFLVEYYYTKHQSGAFHLAPQPDGSNSGRGRDNYFNHGVYRSGVTYRQFGMVSPLWGPLTIEENISMGFASTRLSGVHAGAGGHLSPLLKWKSMISYFKHYGNYDSSGEDSYMPPRPMLATMVNIDWHVPKKPLELGLTLAADQGNLFDDGKHTTRLGLHFHLTWQILQK